MFVGIVGEAPTLTCRICGEEMELKNYWTTTSVRSDGKVTITVMGTFKCRVCGDTARRKLLVIGLTNQENSVDVESLLANAEEAHI